jgi:hypothetical protein
MRGHGSDQLPALSESVRLVPEQPIDEMTPTRRDIRCMTRYEREKPRLGGAFPQAAEGTRTLDLLHGKQTL